MEQLLKKEFLEVVNGLRRGNAPVWTAEPTVRGETIAEHAFDVDDPKEDSRTVKRDFGHGTASYVNGSVKTPYRLRFVCYDEYLHQFVFDDGMGHPRMNLLKDHTRMADFIVYDIGVSRVWLVVHELSTGAVDNKRGRARIQLSSTLNMLCQSPEVKAFIDGFKYKWCVLSARDERVLSPQGMADAFMAAYTVQPEPLEFNFGVINRFGFRAFETSKVVLA